MNTASFIRCNYCAHHHDGKRNLILPHICYCRDCEYLRSELRLPLKENVEHEIESFRFRLTTPTITISCPEISDSDRRLSLSLPHRLLITIIQCTIPPDPAPRRDEGPRSQQ